MRTFEKQRQEHKLGYLLVCISVLFISCQSFKIIPDIYEIMFCRYEYNSNREQILKHFTNFFFLKSVIIIHIPISLTQCPRKKVVVRGINFRFFKYFAMEWWGGMVWPPSGPKKFGRTHWPAGLGRFRCQNRQK